VKRYQSVGGEKTIRNTITNLDSIRKERSNTKTPYERGSKATRLKVLHNIRLNVSNDVFHDGMLLGKAESSSVCHICAPAAKLCRERFLDLYRPEDLHPSQTQQYYLSSSAQFIRFPYGLLSTLLSFLTECAYAQVQLIGNTSKDSDFRGPIVACLNKFLGQLLQYDIDIVIIWIPM